MKNIGCSLNTILIYLKSIMVQVIIFFVFCMCLLVSEGFFWCTEKNTFLCPGSTQIDNSVSQAIQNCGKISITITIS